MRTIPRPVERFRFRLSLYAVRSAIDEVLEEELDEKERLATTTFESNEGYSVRFGQASVEYGRFGGIDIRPILTGKAEIGGLYVVVYAEKLYDDGLIDHLQENLGPDALLEVVFEDCKPTDEKMKQVARVARTFVKLFRKFGQVGHDET